MKRSERVRYLRSINGPQKRRIVEAIVCLAKELEVSIWKLADNGYSSRFCLEVFQTLFQAEYFTSWDKEVSIKAQKAYRDLEREYGCSRRYYHVGGKPLKGEKILTHKWWGKEYRED